MQDLWCCCCILTVDFVSAWRERSIQLVCAQNADEEKDTSPTVADIICLQGGAF